MVKYNEKKLYKRLSCLMCAVLLAFSFIALPISFKNASADEITTNSQYSSRPYTFLVYGGNDTGGKLSENVTELDFIFNFIDTPQGVAFFLNVGGLAVDFYDGNSISLGSYTTENTDYYYYTAGNPYRTYDFTSVVALASPRFVSAETTLNGLTSIYFLAWFTTSFTSVSQLDHYTISFSTPAPYSTSLDSGFPSNLNGSNFSTLNITYYDSSNNNLFSFGISTGYFYQKNYTINGTINSSNVDLNYNYDNAYNQGYRQAQQELTTRYEQLLAIEFDNGFYAGKEQSTNFAQYFLAVAEVPFNVIRNMLNFEILGVNISGLVFAILTGALCITVIRWFI